MDEAAEKVLIDKMWRGISLFDGARRATVMPKIGKLRENEIMRD